jgi:hypothetical protein
VLAGLCLDLGCPCPVYRLSFPDSGSSGKEHESVPTGSGPHTLTVDPTNASGEVANDDWLTR